MCTVFLQKQHRSVRHPVTAARSASSPYRRAARTTGRNISHNATAPPVAWPPETPWTMGQARPTDDGASQPATADASSTTRALEIRARSAPPWLMDGESSATRHAAGRPLVRTTARARRPLPSRRWPAPHMQMCSAARRGRRHPGCPPSHMRMDTSRVSCLCIFPSLTVCLGEQNGQLGWENYSGPSFFSCVLIFSMSGKENSSTPEEC